MCACVIHTHKTIHYGTAVVPYWPDFVTAVSQGHEVRYYFNKLFTTLTYICVCGNTQLQMYVTVIPDTCVCAENLDTVKDAENALELLLKNKERID